MANLAAEETVRAKVILNGVRTSLYPKAKYDYSDQKAGYPKYIGKEDVLMQSFDFSFVSGNNDPTHENTKFWNASPGGKLELNSINPEVAKFFEIGKEYYLDFTLAKQG
jgi:hypothetical protein